MIGRISFVGKLPRGLPGELFFGAQQGIEVEEIDSGK